MPSKENKNTAILVFAYSSNKESAQKRFAQNTGLFESLNQETLAKVKKTKLPYFHFTEKEQLGASFGERFVNAIQEVYAKGFDNIITVGNDSPQLQTKHLIETYEQLQLGKTVLGPTFDGGFYLMGLHKSRFNATFFKRLPWQRFSLFNRISEFLNQADSLVYKLPVLGDIDNIEDVKRLVSFRKSISSILLDLLSLLIPFEKQIITRVFQTFLVIFLQKPFNKGSPPLLRS